MLKPRGARFLHPPPLRGSPKLCKTIHRSCEEGETPIGATTENLIKTSSASKIGGHCALEYNSMSSSQGHSPRAAIFQLSGSRLMCSHSGALLRHATLSSPRRPRTPGSSALTHPAHLSRQGITRGRLRPQSIWVQPQGPTRQPWAHTV